jgi:enamine deaminase RidA (YjgF/YER057c/UK114 family)
MTSTDSAIVVARSESGDSVDVFIHADPASTRDDPRTQFQSMAEGVYRALLDHGLLPSGIVSGWLRFPSRPSWNWRQALGDLWQFSGVLPITALVQPPARPFCACSLSLHAIRTSRQSGVWQAPPPGPAAATVLRAGARHVRLMAVTARPEFLKPGNVADMTYDMFAQAGHALTARGLSFGNVVRTWVHVHDIDHNYGFINQARNRYFADQRLTRLPASTCVAGTPADVDFPVALDVYAVSDAEVVQVQAVAPGSMGEASVYGAAFARATRISEPGRRWLLVSGTASIDAQGRVVAVDDLPGQLACMFGNVETLLADSGMTMGDVLAATAYLKRADHLGDFTRAARARGLGPDVPCTVAVADICRPDWLCEIELVSARKDAPAPSLSGRD